MTTEDEFDAWLVQADDAFVQSVNAGVDRDAVLDAVLARPAVAPTVDEPDATTSTGSQHEGLMRSNTASISDTMSMGGSDKRRVLVMGNVSGAAATHGAGMPSHVQQEKALVGEMRLRVGFAVDIVGFGRREADTKADLQWRLDTLLNAVVAELGVDEGEVIRDVAADSLVVFLPVGVDLARVLPTLLNAVSEHLGRDNRRYRDRLRLRMAVGMGLVGDGPLGHTGKLVIDLHRLVDSTLLREAVHNNPDADLAMLVSQALHDDVIRPGYLKSDDFTRVEVATKEFNAAAWLRIR